MGSPQSYDSRLRLRLGVRELIGVDEAGRGPLAGPVVVAAVLLAPGPHRELAGVRDSKLLTRERREELFRPILRAAMGVSISWAHPRAIERLNILGATLSAMRRAVRRLPPGGLVLVDGNREITALDRPQLTIIDGDAKSLAIGCASVVAKVFRDRWMRRLDLRHPGYGFAQHKGYATPEHAEALKRLGPAAVHRRSFAPVAELLVTEAA